MNTRKKRHVVTHFGYLLQSMRRSTACGWPSGIAFSSTSASSPLCCSIAPANKKCRPLETPLDMHQCVCVCASYRYSSEVLKRLDRIKHMGQEKV
jgi:hypothetical protein